MITIGVEVYLGLFSDCKQMVKYSGTNIQIASVQGPIKVPVIIKGIEVSPKLLQLAGQILQILDWLQYTECQKIRQLRKLKDIPQETISKVILKQVDDAHMIAQLAILSIAYCTSPDNFEKVLADWISAALPRMPEETPKPEYHVTRAEEEEMTNIEKYKVGINKIEQEITKFDNNIKNMENQLKMLRRELREIKTRRDGLIADKEELQGLLNFSFMNMDFKQLMLYCTGEILEQSIIEDFSEFPYLLEVIQKNEPFDINRSLKKLTQNDTRTPDTE